MKKVESNLEASIVYSGQEEKKEQIGAKNTPPRQGKNLAKEKSLDDSKASIERSLKDIDLILSSSKAAIDQRKHYGS